MRTLLNMVPDPRNDDDFGAMSTTLFGASNYFQPLEALGGHCAIEFMLGNNTVVENSDWRSMERNKDTFYEKMMGTLAKKKTVFNEMVKYSIFMA